MQALCAHVMASHGRGLEYYWMISGQRVSTVCGRTPRQRHNLLTFEQRLDYGCPFEGTSLARQYRNELFTQALTTLPCLSIGEMNENTDLIDGTTKKSARHAVTRSNDCRDP